MSDSSGVKISVSENYSSRTFGLSPLLVSKQCKETHLVPLSMHLGRGGPSVSVHGNPKAGSRERTVCLKNRGTEGKRRGLVNKKTGRGGRYS